MKHLITLSLMLLAACVDYRTCDKAARDRASDFILKCVDAGNPRSEDVDMAYIIQNCEMTAIHLFCPVSPKN